MARVIVDIVHSASQEKRLQIFNLVNPKTIEWSSLLPVIQKLFEPTVVDVVSFDDWMKLLRNTDANDEAEVATKPAVKILDFFESTARSNHSTSLQPTRKTGNGVSIRKTLVEMQPIDQTLMEIWLKQ